MPLIDSRQQLLDLGELLKVSAEDTKSEYPMEFVYASFVKEVQMPDSKFFRYGNTIYVVQRFPRDPRKGMFRALNADTAANFLASAYAFVVDAYKAGFDTLVTQFSNQSLLNIFRQVMKNPPNPGMGYSVATLEDGQYQVTVQLGNKREGAR